MAQALEKCPARIRPAILPNVSPPSVVRARIDLQEGRAWRARDRLESFVSQHPTHAEALDLLGDILDQMGDLPRAGRYWLLTSRDDQRARRAIAALRERYPRPDFVLDSLAIRDSLDAYPTEARTRVEALRREAAALGHDWHPRPTRARPTAWERPRQHWWTPVVAIATVFLVVAILVLGVASLGEAVVSLLGWLFGR